MAACEHSRSCRAGRQLLSRGLVDDFVRRFSKPHAHACCWLVAAASRGEETLLHVRPHIQAEAICGVTRACQERNVVAAKRLYDTFQCQFNSSQFHPTAKEALLNGAVEVLRWLFTVYQPSVFIVADLWHLAYYTGMEECSLLVARHAIEQLGARYLVSAVVNYRPKASLLFECVNALDAKELDAELFTAAAAAGHEPHVKAYIQTPRPADELNEALIRACVTGQLPIVQLLWPKRARTTSDFVRFKTACANNRQPVAAWIFERLDARLISPTMCNNLQPELWCHSTTDTLKWLDEKGLLPPPPQELIFRLTFNYWRKGPAVIEWAVRRGFVKPHAMQRVAFLTRNRELFQHLRVCFPELEHYTPAPIDVTDVLHAFQLTASDLVWILQFVRPSATAALELWERLGPTPDHKCMCRILVQHGLVSGVSSKRDYLTHLRLKIWTRRARAVVTLQRFSRSYLLCRHRRPVNTKY